MKKWIACTTVAAGWLAAMGALAQGGYLSDRHEGLNRATETYDKNPGEGDDPRAARRFAAECGAIAPFPGFCACLARKLPAGLSFQQYFAVLSRTKEQNNYSSLAPDVQKTYDAIPEVRDQCAAATAAN